MKKAQEHWDNIAKPLRSLGQLEEMLVKLAGIIRSEQFPPMKKAVLVFCADNGIVKEQVTQTGSEVTATMAQNFAKGSASVNALAKIAHADVFPIDIGIAETIRCPGLSVRKVASGTKNFSQEPAMTRDECKKAILTGIDLIREKKQEGYNCIITGEMGIGNTTTSSAVLSVLEHLPPETVTGRGAGLTEKGIQHKISVIRDAIALHHPDPDDIIGVLSALGGFDLCGITGAFLGGAFYHVPVLIDGFISAVAALCAVRLAPLCKYYIYATHCSAEPAGKCVLDAIGLHACLHCDMCLGEGTGAVIGSQLFDFALAVYQGSADFQTAAVSKYQLLK